jgi:hypothetical protein
VICVSPLCAVKGSRPLEYRDFVLIWRIDI